MDKASELKKEAKKYVELIYRLHRDDDIIAWNQLIDVLFLYVDQAIAQAINTSQPQQPRRRSTDNDGIPE